MKKTALTFIDQESVTIDFQLHLVNELNKRILFSARFGTGKSTFLNYYFENEGAKYIALRLYPVNYSISHNRDVFELIKYDLIYELLSKYPDAVNLQKDEYSLALISQMFLLHGLKIDPLLKSILKAASPEHEVYTDIVEQLKGIVDQYSSYKRGVEKDEVDILSNYIKQLKNYKGTAHEYDEISELISSMLENVKEDLVSKGSKSVETVLIIDDIDRLDPEHVFRLFNIFSAHYDSVTDENKFGFDKVIFVCDYNNIRLMYEHRYGAGVDFSGYIDKFYSTEIFNYDNKMYVRNRLREIFMSKPKSFASSYSQDLYYPGRTDLYNAFEYLLSVLFEVNAITLRKLDQFYCYDVPTYEISAGTHGYNFTSSNYPFLMLTHLLKKLFTVQELNIYFKRLSDKFEIESDSLFKGTNKTESVQNYLKNIALPFMIETNKFFSDEDVSPTDKNGVVQVNGKKVFYSLGYNTSRDLRFMRLSSASEALESPDVEQKNVFEFLLFALKKSENLIKFQP